MTMEYVYQIEALKDDFEELEENNKLLQKDLRCRTREHEKLKRDHKELAQELVSTKLQFDERLKLQDEEQAKLRDELERHKKLLEESEKAREELQNRVPVADDIATTRETNKQTREYHYKWKMAEQENAVLQTTCARLESQVARYKESLKEAETNEGDMKAEIRKIKRESRELQARVEELETSNSHLQKRLDRLRSRNLMSDTDTTTMTTITSTDTAAEQ